MSSEEANKAVVRRFYAEMDAGNLDAMDQLVAEDYIDHNPPPFPGLEQGRTGLKQAFQIFWEATPGRHEIEDQVAEGDKVVTRLTAFGKHVGDLPGRGHCHGTGHHRDGRRLSTACRTAKSWSTGRPGMTSGFSHSSESSRCRHPVDLTIGTERHRQSLPTRIAPSDCSREPRRAAPVSR